MGYWLGPTREGTDWLSSCHPRVPGTRLSEADKRRRKTVARGGIELGGHRQVPPIGSKRTTLAATGRRSGVRGQRRKRKAELMRVAPVPRAN